MKTKNHFAKEITLALLIKFALFGLVWWLFFAGQKVPVNEVRLAQRLFAQDSSVLK